MRSSDEVIVRGCGSYLADLQLPGMCDVAFARSPIGAGTILSVDTSAIEALPGNASVVTGFDLVQEGRRLPIPMADGTTFDWVPLASEEVGFVGEPVAAVVAETRALAEDGAELVFVEYEPNDVWGEFAWPDTPGFEPARVVYDFSDTVGDPDRAFDRADVAIEHTFRHGRQSALPLETRGVIASLEPHTGGLTVWSSTQIPSVLATAISRFVGLPQHLVRVVTPDVGGGFGLKATVCAEELTVAWLALRLNRPVRWVEDRRENLLGGYHAHDQRIRIRMGATSDGQVVAVDALVGVDVGVRPGYPFGWSLEPLSVGRAILSCYHVPNIRVRAIGVRSNKPPIGPYRGVGAGAGAFAGERSLDLMAAELGLDPAEIRRRNLLTPEKLPYRNPLNVTLEVGNYPTLLAKALNALEYDRWRSIRAAQNDETLIGIGMVVFVENSGPGSIAYHQRGVSVLPGYDQARVDVDEYGRVSVAVSSADAGQRHTRMYRNVVRSILPVDPDHIRVIEGDTASSPPGMGTFASRAGSVQVSAVAVATERIRDRMLRFAAVKLECGPDDIRVTDTGFVTIDGAATLSFREVAEYAYRTQSRVRHGLDFDPGVGGLSELAVWDGEISHPVGVHCAVVAVDRETLIPSVLAYVAADDFGTALDLDGAQDQIVGGVSMGAGNALFEEHRFRDDGQILTTSLLDYLVPLADSQFPVHLVRTTTPTARTHLGSTGVAEAGTIGAAACIGAAVADALRPLGVVLDALPATPERIFQLLSEESKDDD